MPMAEAMKTRKEKDQRPRERRVGKGDEGGVFVRAMVEVEVEVEAEVELDGTAREGCVNVEADKGWA